MNCCVTTENEQKIQVLLSTYNGEIYIREQLDSILNQKGVSVHIIIRDDGSTDNTICIIKEYRKKYGDSVIHIIEGNNLGFAQSYYELVKFSGDYNYFSFCDQDDVWDNDKLLIGIENLKKIKCQETPNTYFCNCQLVDEKLNPLGKMYENLQLTNRKIGSLLENRAAGCTMIFNKIARNMFLRGNFDKILYHDHWIFVICSYLGTVIYDNNTHILYRQHSNNQIGSKPTFKKIWNQRKKQLKRKNYHPREYMAQELLNNFKSKFNDDEILLLAIFAEYRTNTLSKLKMLLNRNIKMSSAKKYFWFVIHVLIGNV